ncbi:redoxin domain-containing protein [Sulfurimonas sp. SAG-AH-194-C21]|nr:redoxin domain-containing protein [Sulfurimonas sp. SAG-AH-194-C21]MDF1883861.1 redoxin domain-containing protein [Sulfurimonas sp. SAG-AH-194-C21]
MLQKIKHYFKELLFFTLFITIFANGLSLYKAQELNKSDLALTPTKLINSTLFTPDTNKPLMVHIWATWCPICKVEADNINRVAQYYEVVSIAVDSGTDYDIHTYMQAHDLGYKVINDNSNHISDRLNIHIFPTTLIYDKNQKLVFSEVGYTSSFGLFIRMLWVSF